MSTISQLTSPNDREALFAIQSHLRNEIEWRSKTCMYTWYFLVSITGLSVNYLLMPELFLCNNTWFPTHFISFGLVAISCIWVIGLFYLLEKRSWITFIAHYLKTVVEPRLYSANTKNGLHGWELQSFTIKEKWWLSISEIETNGSAFIILLLCWLNILILIYVNNQKNVWWNLILLVHLISLLITRWANLRFQKRKTILEELFPESPTNEAGDGI